MDEFKMGDIVIITQGKCYGVKRDYTGSIGIINHIYDCTHGVWFGKRDYTVFTPKEMRKATQEEIESRKKEIDRAKDGIELYKNFQKPLNLNIKAKGENYYVKH